MHLESSIVSASPRMRLSRRGRSSFGSHLRVDDWEAWKSQHRTDADEMVTQTVRAGSGTRYRGGPMTLVRAHRSQARMTGLLLRELASDPRLVFLDPWTKGQTAIP